MRSNLVMRVERMSSQCTISPAIGAAIASTSSLAYCAKALAHESCTLAGSSCHWSYIAAAYGPARFGVAE